MPTNGKGYSMEPKTTETPVTGLNSELNSLKSDFSKLRQDIVTLFDDVVRTAKAGADEGATKGSEYADLASKKASDAKGSAEEIIRKHPLLSVGTALGVGALVAMMRRK